MQLSLGAERVDDAVGDDRRGARPFVEAEVVAVCRRVLVPPHRRARPGVERIDDLLRADAMENDDPILDDDRCGEALADGLAPHDPRPLRRPRFGKGGSCVDAVSVGAEKLRPVGGRRDAADRQKQQGYADASHHRRPRL